MIKKTHVGSYGVIINNKQIVLIRKKYGGYKNKLDLPGGGIEHNETPIKALHRELQEEAGVKVINEKLIDVFHNNIVWKMSNNEIEDLQHLGIIYEITVSGNIKKEPDGLDSLGAEWYNINELDKNELTPFVVFSLEKLGYKLK